MKRWEKALIKALKQILKFSLIPVGFLIGIVIVSYGFQFNEIIGFITVFLILIVALSTADYFGG